MRDTLFLVFVFATAAIAQQQAVWKFDRLDKIGGHKTTIVGSPKVIQTPKGKAVQFGGAGDALFLDVHPLAGAKTFTWEVIFRPDGDGRPEQRFFHMHQNGTLPITGCCSKRASSKASGASTAMRNPMMARRR